MVRLPDTFVFWQNPMIGVAVIITDNNRIILGVAHEVAYQGAGASRVG